MLQMINHIENWNFVEVSVWLQKIGLEKYVDLFYFHEIDGEVLLSMTESDLYSSQLKITTFGDIRKFGVAIEKLKSENKAARKQENDAENSPHLLTSELVPICSSGKGFLVDIKHCIKKNPMTAFVSSSDSEYDNDIDAALNGAAFVGGYDEDLDIIYSDDEDKISIPPLDAETEMKVMKWVENMKLM